MLSNPASSGVRQTAISSGRRALLQSKLGLCAAAECQLTQLSPYAETVHNRTRRRFPRRLQTTQACASQGKGTAQLSRVDVVRAMVNSAKPSVGVRGGYGPMGNTPHRLIDLSAWTRGSTSAPAASPNARASPLWLIGPSSFLL